MRSVFIVLALAGCAASQNTETPIGAFHSPYPGKPEYMATPPGAHAMNLLLLKDQQERGNTPPLSLQAPEAEADGDADDATPVAPSGSLTVTPTEQAPLPNRVADPQTNWQPNIITPGDTPITVPQQ